MKLQIHVGTYKCKYMRTTDGYSLYSTTVILTTGKILYWEMLVMSIECMAHRMTLYFTTQDNTTLCFHAWSRFVNVKS